MSERIGHPDLTAELRPDDPAYTMAATGETVSWAQLRDRSRQGGHLLRSLGLEAGGGFAMLLENHLRFLELCWVGQRSGVYFTPISWHLTASEIEYIVKDSGSTVFFASARFAEVAQEVASRLDGVTFLSVDEPFGPFSSYVDQRDSMPTTPVADECFGDDMLYTSGTTGRPKGVRRPLTGGPIIEYPAHYDYYAAAGYNDRSIHYSAGPLYHASPIHTTLIGMTLGGSVVVSDTFDAEDALAMIESHGVTHSNWVPTHFVRLLRLTDEVKQRHDLSSLQLALHGAAACPVWVKEQMIDWWGPILTEYYGGSEGFGGLIITSEDWLEHRGSVGRPVTGPIHILDPVTLDELPAGEIGLIHFELMGKMEYHNDPDKTAKALSPQGWGTLGDLGHVDADGYLYLADRRADLIITGGVNVYPREVEDRLLSHPLVADVAVFGIPDDEWGETVHAVIQLIDPADQRPELTSELDQYCKAELAKTKCPRGYAFIDQLPRQENGKLYKRLLRDEYVKAATA